MSPNVALVERFAAAFLAGQLSALDALLADDCIDLDPIPLQPPGRDGVVFKLALFHAQHPGFTSSFIQIYDASGEVVADWSTTLPDGARSHWRGRFQSHGGRITSFGVRHVG